MKQLPSLITLCTLVLFARCGSLLSSSDNGGGSSSTTNTFTLLVSQNMISGKTPPGNRVAVYAAEYQPGFTGSFADSVICGRDSGFAFENLQPGFYRVFAWDATHQKGIHVGIIPVPPQPNTIVSLSDSLRSLSVITGSVSFENVAAGTVHIATVCILGTPFYAVTDSTGLFHFAGVPPGSFVVEAALGVSTVPKIFPVTTYSTTDYAFVKVSPDSAASPIVLTVSP